jgi:hypothetical protein
LFEELEQFGLQLCVVKFAGGKEELRRRVWDHTRSFYNLPQDNKLFQAVDVLGNNHVSWGRWFTYYDALEHEPDK